MTDWDSHSSLSDWQCSLFEAIRQRDASRAVLLAQRCVHRYGMPALEALLERANEVQAETDNGSARDWLLPLLTQPSPPPDPIHPAPSQLETISAPLPASTRLDEAFAPLEIAFPPLPTVAGDPEKPLAPQEPGLAASAPVAVEGLEENRGGAAAENAWPGEPPEIDEPPSQVTRIWGEQDPPSDLAPPSATDTPELVDAAPLLNSAEVGAEAPLPSFAPDTPLQGQPTERRVRYPSRRATHRPAPIPPELERWLVWLPCAGRPRAR